MAAHPAPLVEPAAVAAEGAPAAALVKLTLADFRCYAKLRLDLEPSPIVLTGPNGAGKTNLLEAVSFLAPGRGLRRAALAEIEHASGSAAAEGASALQPPTGWAVAATIETAAGPVTVGTGL